MKKENMHKLNLSCSEADHKGQEQKMTKIFINAQKEFREKK